MGIFGFKSTAMAGGLYFGPPAWRVHVWPHLPEIQPPPAVPHETPVDRQSLRDLLAVICPHATAHWTPALQQSLSQLNDQSCSRLVLNLIPEQPESQLHVGLTHFAMPEMTAGLALAADCLKPRQVVVAVNKHDSFMVNAWRKESAEKNYQLAAVVDRYPQSHPLLLLRAVCLPRLRAGDCPMDSGVVCLDAVTCWVLGYWYIHRIGPAARPLELFSDGAEPGVAYIRPSEFIGDILDRAGIPWQGRQCVVNGMLTGMQVDPATATAHWDTSCISVRDIPAAEPEHDCIRCGWCVSVCPTSLNPLALYSRIKPDYPPVGLQEADACIQCGLCSYVCPSRIPLAAGIAQLTQPAAVSPPVKSEARP